MRIRTIKPEFWSHPVMARLPERVQLLAIALLCHADDHGYFKADEAIVRGFCMPFCKDLRKVRQAMRLLVEIGWIQTISHPEQGAIGHVTHWSKHQKVDHPRPSLYRGYFQGLAVSRELREGVAMDQGTGIGEQGAGKGNTLTGMFCSEQPAEAGSSEPVTTVKEKGSSHLNGSETEGIEAPGLVFPTVGARAREWLLLDEKLNEYRSSYPGIDVESACRAARQWIIDNPKKRKTPEGMPQFLNGWLGRAQNRAGMHAHGQGTIKPGNPYHQAPSTEEDHRRDDGDGPGGWGSSLGKGGEK